MPTSFTITAPATAVTSLDPAGRVSLDLFGRDLMFTDDLQVGPAGDYLLIEAQECVRQAIYRRLLVAPGEYAVRPEYGVGVPTYVKKRRSPAVLAELRQRIITQIEREDRVTSVADVVIEPFDGDTCGVRIYVKVSILGNPARFGYEFQE